MIQNHIPELSVQSSEVRNYFTGVLTWGSGAAILLGFLCLLTMLKVKVNPERQSLSVNREENERTPLLANS